MGFHVCKYCEGEHKAHSSGDITMVFENGHAWIMPDMILHYIAEHYYIPPQEFIDDVLTEKLVNGQRDQTKGLSKEAGFPQGPPTKVGYLSGDYKKGFFQGRGIFFLRLWKKIEEAKRMGTRRQTRGR